MMRFRVILISVVLSLVSCSYTNLESTKKEACVKWKEVGYNCVGYEGYQWGVGFGKYGGARVWHTLVRPEDPRTVYSGYVQRWGDEFHVYGPTAVNAIKAN